jgi:hypothetical protein
MKIYSVRTYNDKSLVYYGYTKQPLYKRLYDYRSRYKRHLKNCDNFLIVYEILKHKNEYIVLEKELETDNKDIVKGILNQYISNNDCLNRKNINRLTNDLSHNNFIENELKRDKLRLEQEEQKIKQQEEQLRVEQEEQ